MNKRFGCIHRYVGYKMLCRDCSLKDDILRCIEYRRTHDMKELVD